MRRTTSLLCTAALAAVALAATAFAPAPPTTATTAPAVTARVPEVRVEVGDDGTVHRTIDGRSDRFGLAPDDDLRTLAAWRDRVRRTVEARGLTTASAMDECGDGCEEPPGSEVWTSVETTGDLDGDGTGDVLVLEAGYDGDSWTSFTAARSGADGHELWTSQDAGVGFVAAVPDVDGDGLVDLVSLLWTQGMGGVGTCTLHLSCRYTESLTDSLDFTVVRGVTGDVVGSHAVTSTYEFAYEDAGIASPAGFAGTEEYRVDVEDGFFGFSLVDLDGDGTHQLVHESFDATFTRRFTGTINDTPMGWADAFAWHTVEELGGEVVVADLVTGATETLVTLADAIPYVSVIARADGHRLLVDVLPEYGEEYGGCVFVDPAGGDCARDHGLPTSGANGAAPTRTLYGPDLEPVWEVPMPDWSFVVYGAGTDLDGDGVEDLFDLRIDAAGEFFEDIVVAVDGATGEDLWTADATFVAAAGDTLVGGRFRHDEQVAVDAVIVDPATGQVLAERELVTLPAWEETPDTVTFGGVWFALVPLTGDDLDVLAEAYVGEYEAEEVCEVWEEPNGDTSEWCYLEPGELISEDGQLRGVDGRDLRDLVSLSDPSFWLFDVPDLDGGDAELLGMQVGEGPEVVRALRLDGTPLWELASPQHFAGLLGTPAGTADVLVVDDAAGTFGVRDGADLGVRWEVALPG